MMRVNKQIYVEATRILYGANEFIIVEIGPIYPDDVIGDSEEIQGYVEDFQRYALQTFRNVPAFRKLSQAKVTNPILRVSIAMIEKPQDQKNWFTLIISPEVIPRLFDALWIYGADRGFYTNCSLALDFRNRNPSRNTFLNEHILKRWDQMYPFGEVRLTGDIDAVVTNHLKQPSALFPFEEIIARNLEMIQSRAENFYRRNDFASAYFCWYHLQRYWTFYLQLEELTHTSLTGLLFARPPETRLVKALNVSAYKVGVSVFGILKILLRLRNYNLAVRIANSPTKWLNREEMEFTWNLKPYTSIAPVLRVKFAFCCALAFVAQGQYQNEKGYIGYVVLRLRSYSDLYAQSTYEEMFNQLCQAIDNELIQRKSRWRCGRLDKVDPKKKGGSE
jgi:hypothetical protein